MLIEQHKMSREELDCCRLCSSPKNLISMFSGKSRPIRNFLRKMIEETVHIKIEQDDIIPSVCFNCSVDVSNFYFFKLNCLQNERDLKDIHSPNKAKRHKLHSLTLKEIHRPDIHAAETVLNWLNSKRVSLKEISETLIDKDTQTIQAYCHMATQSVVVETLVKESQTSSPKPVDSKIQCDIINPHSPNKVSVRSRASQTRSLSTETKPSVCLSCTKLNGYESSKKESLSRYCQTEVCRRYEKSSQTNTKRQDICCQTDNKNMSNKVCQTEDKKLTQSLLQNSIVNEVVTHDRCAQAESCNLVNKHTQYDLAVLNGFKNCICLTKAKADSKETENNYKIADPQTFTDALLNGFDNIFVSKTTQTELTMNQCDQFNIFTSYFSNKDSYLSSPGTDIFSKKVDTKLNVKIPLPVKLKGEIISPVESLTISTNQSLDSSGLSSPQSSDLLQVNATKSDYVKICKLCDKILYNRKEVVAHNKTHMKCNICKRKFKSLKATQYHVTDCKVKQFGILPSVNLVRIDQTSEIKDKYFKTVNL